MSDDALATPPRKRDDVHRQGCKREDARPSLTMPGYEFCPPCNRLVKLEVAR